MSERQDRVQRIRDLAKERILVVDGAMGTMVQTYKLEEADYRGDRFKDHAHDLKGNNDILVLTKPQVIKDIHLSFLEAGADFVSTDTFNGTSISQLDYGMEDIVHEINREGARLAREAADEMTEKTPDRPRFVLGSMGPTNRTASISPDVNNPGFRNTSFDELKEAYKEQARALIEGGADLLLVETIFDTLNAKAAIFGVEELGDELGEHLDVMVSGTITDMSGRNLSGQTMTAFWYSMRHTKPFSIGLNCSFGAEQLRPSLVEMAKEADTLVCCYPNAGLPNELGEYDESPDQTSDFIKEWAEKGLVNIVGGCCGTTPAHIAKIAEKVSEHAPRKIPEVERKLRLSGLEPFTTAA